MKNVLIIPIYNPSKLLIDLTESLLKSFLKIIVIDDGSISKGSEYIFKKLESFPNTVVIKHKNNKGKGAALKTGFSYCIDNIDFRYIITADGDGQHLQTDIIKVLNATLDNNNDLILGERNFGSGVPFRNRLGNIITAKVFDIIYGLNLKDTQTGLRAYNKNIIKDIVRLKGNKYQYESNVLSWLAKTKKKISTVNISTIYLNNNSSSHFSPIKDSVSIYMCLLGFPLSSFFSFLVDFTIFIILYKINSGLFVSVCSARFFSGTFNFLLNIKFYLSNQKQIIWYLKRYLFLFIFILIISYFLTLVLTMINIYTYLAKILADSFLFFISYYFNKNYLH